MLAGVMSIRSRRREQSVQEDIDVAHGEAVIVSNEVERVVEHAFDIRQVGFFLELLLVMGHHPEGIDQQMPGGPVRACAARRCTRARRAGLW